jgi:hypothetical protein
MALLPLIPHSTNTLHIAPNSKVLVGEASEMGLRITQLYDDACDEGLCLMSHKTGECSYWYLSQRVTSPDSELMAWVFKPCAETLRKTPVLEGWELRVLND